MNNPEYILTDEMEAVVAATKTALSLTVLDFQYGYVEELNETLQQYEADPAKFDKKFPLVWLAEPYTIDRGEVGIYGTTDPLDIYIINTTIKTWKARERMTNNYKPILFPIYRELMKQIQLSLAFTHQTPEHIRHKITKGYYWGEAQKTVLNDAVDCLKIGGIKLRIDDKQDCTPTKSF